MYRIISVDLCSHNKIEVFTPLFYCIAPLRKYFINLGKQTTVDKYMWDESIHLRLRHLGDRVPDLSLHVMSNIIPWGWTVEHSGHSYRLRTSKPGIRVVPVSWQHSPWHRVTLRLRNDAQYKVASKQFWEELNCKISYRQKLSKGAVETISISRMSWPFASHPWLLHCLWRYKWKQNNGLIQNWAMHHIVR